MDVNTKKTTQEINRINQNIAREKERKRKQRTRRLIQKGAMLEKYFEIEDLSVEDTEILLKKIAPKIKKAREKRN